MKFSEPFYFLRLVPFRDTASVFESDPARLLPQLLQQMVALGEVARQLSQALGGNNHRLAAIHLLENPDHLRLRIL